MQVSERSERALMKTRNKYEPPLELTLYYSTQIYFAPSSLGAAINNMTTLFLKSLETDLAEEMIESSVSVIVDEKIKNMTMRKAEEVMQKSFEPMIDAIIEEHALREVNQWIKDRKHLSASERSEEVSERSEASQRAKRAASEAKRSEVK